jgi:pseudouridine-5'-phosphate glycosidase
MSTVLRVHPEIADALHAKSPVVLLETAVLTCGLPTTSWDAAHGACPAELDPSAPLHHGTALAMAAVIRKQGAIPAVTAIISGVPRVGLTDDELAELADLSACGHTAKASTATMAAAMAGGKSAGTTVSGTLRLAGAVAAQGIPLPHVFATGGIGGIHTGWPAELDVSADLGELARQQVCVVCAGPKSIIDSGRTMELLESLGVPVLGLGIDRLPGFQSLPTDDSPMVTRVDSPSEAAKIAAAHWMIPGSGGVLLTQSPPAHSALAPQLVSQLAAEAEAAVTVTGPARTPALLSTMATRSGGSTLRSNIDLLVSNAAAAAIVAVELKST